ncbi:MAG: ATP-dependent protease [Rickettsia endosymbiont of Labidopullus appendiculatus]|nr:ATP-dependent protease [Rickettsia endosymbiont of Labidopullus appendiculatus]
MSKNLPMKPLIFGVKGTSLTDDQKQTLSTHPVFGFILYARNIEDSEQLKQLVAELRALYTHKIFILIDQEGGRVARLDALTGKGKYSAAAEFGGMYDKGEDASKKVYDNYSNIMNELKKYDLNSPCCPVADLYHPEAHDVIGTRSFGKEVDKVITLSTAAVKGITNNDGIAIIKHIPGHGRAIVDSHRELPHVTASLDKLNETDFKVFKALAEQFKDNTKMWAMTAHIVFEALDTNHPVTLSIKAIQFIRENIGFEGKLITDDICMHALHSKDIIVQRTKNDTVWKESVANAAKEAVEAGCDLVICSGDMAEYINVWDAL